MIEPHVVKASWDLHSTLLDTEEGRGGKLLLISPLVSLSPLSALVTLEACRLLIRTGSFWRDITVLHWIGLNIGRKSVLRFSSCIIKDKEIAEVVPENIHQCIAGSHTRNALLVPRSQISAWVFHKIPGWLLGSKPSNCLWLLIAFSISGTGRGQARL